MATPAGPGRRRDRHAVAADPRRADLAGRGVRGIAGRDGDRRRHRHHRGLLRRVERQRADAHHRLLPGDPRPAPRDHRRGRLGRQPHASDLRHRAAAVDDDRPHRPGTGEERARARLRQARAVARSERRSDHLPARPSADRPPADGEHRADRRRRHLRRDRAGVPGARRCERDHLGQHHRVRVPPHRDLLGGVVGGHPGGPLRGAGDHGLLLARSGDRGRPEPAPEGLLPVASEVPNPAGPDDRRHGPR